MQKSRTTLESRHLYSNRLEIPEAEYGSPASQGGCARPKATAHTGCGMSRRTMLKMAGFAGAACFFGKSAIDLSAAPESSPVATSEKTGRPTPKRRFALNTGTLIGLNLPIEEEIDVTAKAGYDGIEIWMMRLEKYLGEGKKLADLKKRLDDHGLTVENAIGFATWIVDDESQRAKGVEQIKRDMERLAEIGCHRMAAPASGATSKRIDDLEACGARYRTILELGEQFHVTPLLELWGSSATLRKLSDVTAIAIAAAHPNASLLLDAYHLYKGGNTFAGLNLLNGKAMHVFHLNDYPANPPRESIADKDRVYPGDGVCPLKELIATLDAIGFDGVYSLELFNPAYWAAKDPLAVATTGLEKMKRLFQ